MKERLFWSTLVLVALSEVVFLMTQRATPDNSAQIIPVDTSKTPPPINAGHVPTSHTETPPETPRADAPSALNAGVIPSNPDYPTLDARLAEMQTRRNGKSFSREAVRDAMLRSSAWTNVNDPGDQLSLNDEQRYDGREFIAFDPIKLESLMPGDTLEIPLEQQHAVYNLRVDKVEVFPDGNVSWRGHLQEFGEEATVSFTRGDSLTVASISTPEKHFVLQAHGEQGWIAIDRTLFKFDSHETDAVIPDAPARDDMHSM